MESTDGKALTGDDIAHKQGLESDVLYVQSCTQRLHIGGQKRLIIKRIHQKVWPWIAGMCMHMAATLAAALVVSCHALWCCVVLDVSAPVEVMFDHVVKHCHV